MGGLQAQDYCLSSKHERLWEEIASHDYVFDRIDREVDAIDGIERSDILAVMERLFGGQTRAKLATHVIGGQAIAAPKGLAACSSTDNFADLLCRSPPLDIPPY